MELDELNVSEFLRSIGIRRTIKGYYYLKHGVLACMQDPTISCQQICEDLIANDSKDRTWKSVYRTCLYAIKTSDNETYQKMAPSAFFKEVSTIIHNNNLERSVR